MGRLGRPPLVDATRRTAQVGVALTAAEADTLGRWARHREVRPAVLARELVLDGIGRLDRQDPAQAEQPTSPSATDETDAARLRIEILQLGTQVARVGININQISRNLHRGPAQVPDDLATRLDHVAALIADTRKLIAVRGSWT